MGMVLGDSKDDFRGAYGRHRNDHDRDGKKKDDDAGQ